MYYSEIEPLQVRERPQVHDWRRQGGVPARAGLPGAVPADGALRGRGANHLHPLEGQVRRMGLAKGEKFYTIKPILLYQ